MSRILVIEPYKMLRHAFAVALFERSSGRRCNYHCGGGDIVRPRSSDCRWSGAAGAKLIDAPATFDAVQNWKFPIIWIDAGAETQVPGGDRLLHLKWPIDKDALKKAIVECLGRVNGSNGWLILRSRAEQDPRLQRRESRAELKSSRPADGEKKFIELVDVVE